MGGGKGVCRVAQPLFSEVEDRSKATTPMVKVLVQNKQKPTRQHRGCFSEWQARWLFRPFILDSARHLLFVLINAFLSIRYPTYYFFACQVISVQGYNMVGCRICASLPCLLVWYRMSVRKRLCVLPQFYQLYLPCHSQSGFYTLSIPSTR